MSLFTIYWRVLGQLGSEKSLAVRLVFANLALAVAAFAEPVLWGWIVDILTSSQGTGVKPTFGQLLPMIALWLGFGLFTIGAGVLVALHADRLSHRRRLAVMASYFEHVLALPIAFHTQTHSGRVLKVMLEGTSSMAWLWLGFFREHCAALVGRCVVS